MKTKPGLGGVTAAPWHRASTGTKRASGRTAARSRGSARAAGGEKKPAESPCKRKAFPPRPCKAASPCCSARGRGGLPDSLPVLSAARPLPGEDLGTGWGHQSGHSTKRQLVLNTKSTRGDARHFPAKNRPLVCHVIESWLFGTGLRGAFRAAAGFAQRSGESFGIQALI